VPFKNLAQSAACFAKKNSGEAGSWDCGEWAEKTDYKHLPKKKKKTKEGHDMLTMGARAAEGAMITKLASDVQITPELVRHLASTVKLSPAAFVKIAYDDPADFIAFLRTVCGVKQAAAGPIPGILSGLLKRMRSGAKNVAGKINTGMGGSRIDNLLKTLTTPRAASESVFSTPTRRLAAAGVATGTGLAGASAVNKMRGGAKPVAPVAIAPKPVPGAPEAMTAMQSPQEQINGGQHIPETPAALPPLAPTGSATAPQSAGMSPAMKALVAGGGMALGGLGAGAVARKVTSKKKEKVAMFSPAVIKKAQDLYRDKALRTTLRYLDKVAADLPPYQQTGIRTVQASLAHGDTLAYAIKLAYPLVGPEARGAMAYKLVQAAAKQANSDCGGMSTNIGVQEPESHTGDVASGMNFTKNNVGY
jgi:hypothetical protein